MKKIILIVVLVFTSIFVKAYNFKMIEIPDPDGCIEYAHDAAWAEYDFYGGMSSEELESAAWDYYFDCKDIGSSEFILDPVFL